MVKIPDWYETREPIIESPDGWTGGKVRHTGGGIFCREWERSLPGGRKVVVIYNSQERGIGVDHYPDSDTYAVDDSVGDFALGRDPEGYDTHSDRGYAEAARRIMQIINLALGDTE